MKASNTERLTPVGAGRRGLVGQLVLVALLALGPERLARVISLVTSTFTLPLTGSISVAGNPYEVFNLELLMIYLVAVIGLNLLVQVGMLSVGHTAPFAVGAYFVAIMTVTHHWSFYLALRYLIRRFGLTLTEGDLAARSGELAARPTLPYPYVIDRTSDLPKMVDIHANSVTRLDVNIDTGIR